MKSMDPTEFSSSLELVTEDNACQANMLEMPEGRTPPCSHLDGQDSSLLSRMHNVDELRQSRRLLHLPVGQERCCLGAICLHEHPKIPLFHNSIPRKSLHFWR